MWRRIIDRLKLRYRHQSKTSDKCDTQIVRETLEMAREGPISQSRLQSAVASLNKLGAADSDVTQHPVAIYPADVFQNPDETSRALKQMLTGEAETVHQNFEQEPNPTTIDYGILEGLEHHIADLEDSWRFDAFRFDKLVGRSGLSTLAFWVFHKCNLISQCQMDEIKLVKFFSHIENLYHEHPYHNRLHVMEVLHMTYMFLRYGQCVVTLTTTDRLAAIFAAVIHDVDHRGVTNDFLIRTLDDIAIAHNDASPLENHHLVTAFSLLLRHPYNFLTNLSAAQFASFRKTVIQIVLATDMKCHFQLVNECERRWGASETTVPDTHARSDNDVHLVLKLAVKLADLSHITAEPHRHVEWVTRLETEFYEQGDKERHLSMDISPLMDRERPGMATSQTKFFDVVVIPLLAITCDIYPGASPLIKFFKENQKAWKAHNPPDTDANNDISLLVAFGGFMGIVAAVERFYERVLQDPLIAHYFIGRDMDNLRRKQVKFMRHAFADGAPLDIEYIKKAHAHLHPFPDALAFGRIVANFQASLEDLHVRPDVIYNAVSRLQPLAAVFRQ